MSLPQSPRRLNDKNKPSCYRMTVLGASAVGKTALIRRFLNDEFIDKYKETVEDLFVRTYQVNGQFIQAHIFDTAGNSQFPAMRRLSIGSAQAYLLVYDMTSEYTFPILQDIVNEIKDMRTPSELRDIPIVIAGNKIDLPSDQHRVSIQMIHTFMLNELLDCRTIHLHTSAKNAHNVRAIFDSFIKLSPMFLDQSIIRSPSIIPVALMATAFDFVQITKPDQMMVNDGSPQRQRRLSLQSLKFGGGGIFNGGSCYAMAQQKITDTIAEDATTEGVEFRNHSNSFGTTTRVKPQNKQYMQNGEKIQANMDAAQVKINMAVNGKAKLFKRNKTKSHDDYDAPECMVQ